METAKLPFSYTLRRSTRSKRLRILVSDGKVEAVAPPKLAAHKIHQFVCAKQDWVMQALAKMAQKTAQQAALAPSVCGDGTTIPYLGRHYPLTVQPSPLKRIKITFDNGFIAHLPNTLALAERNEAITMALHAWLKKQAMQQVQRLVDIHANRQQLVPRSINIRSQKSRWGSCGIHNDIQINWLLILAPIEVLEYVVVHELCHLRERNHSANFWALVAWHLPNYQAQRLWLKQWGRQLMAWLSIPLAL